MGYSTVTLGTGVDSITSIDTDIIDISGLTVGGLSTTGIPAITTIDMSSYTSTTGSYSTICNPTATVSGTSYSYSTPYTISGANGTSSTWVTTNTSQSGIQVKGDAEFDGDIKWKGRSLGEMIEKIESRLSILTPNPKKLEQYEALQKAYRHYKMLEALCEEKTESEDDK